MSNEIKVLDKGFVRLIDHYGDDSTIVQSARVSYGNGTKTKKEDRELLRYLVRHKHTSPLEQVEFRFHMKLPIFCARQLVRTRTANLNEISGRYSIMKNEAYIPDKLKLQDTINRQGSIGRLDEDIENITINNMYEEQESLFENYESYIKAGVCREQARINLPLSTYTEWIWKMDLHNLFHFLGLRMHPHAQLEMQEYAEAIFELIKPIVPVSCEAFEDYRCGAGTFSKKEMDLLESIVKREGDNDVLQYIQEEGFSGSKRELKEFLKKLDLK